MTEIKAFKARVEAFGGEALFRRSALRIRDGAGVIEEILSAGRFRHIVEIGTYRGITAAFMAGFCERVTTIDLRRGQNEQGDAPFDRHAFWSAMGVADKIDLRLVRDDAEKAAVIGPLDFDFAFVDGDHAAPAPARDFALVKRCGAVLLHDCDGHNGVVDLVRSLPTAEVEIRDIFAFWRR